MIEKPMLAGTCNNTATLRYPVYVSPKLDGIRCIVQGGRVLSRKFKDIPNVYIRETLLRVTSDLPIDVKLDGELMVGDCFQACTSGIMSRSGEPDFCYHVFDCLSGSGGGFAQRFREAKNLVHGVIGSKYVTVVAHRIANNEAELLEAEERYLEHGYEGLMVRDPEGPYKFGRSTEKQGWLLKVKRFVDSEAEVIGFEELLHNANEATKDELGHTKRSSAKGGKVPMGTLGKFHVRDLKSGVEFYVGTGLGLTQNLRQEIWDDRDSYVGRIVKYKSQPHGVKDAPRLPIWLGFRDPKDM